MIRVILNGLGAVGQDAGRLILEKPYLECVGAVDIDPAKAGKDLGDILGVGRKLGIKVSASLDAVVAQGGADIVLDSTHSFMKDTQDLIFTSVRGGLNFVSSCEELGYPAAENPGLAHEIDELAKSHSVTVLGTGTNPGFIQDLVPLVFLGCCSKVKSITARRLNECSALGAATLRQFAIGATREDFDRQVADGSLISHVGHPHSMMMIADALGWKITDTRRTLRGWVSGTRRQGAFFTVEPGRICNVETVTTGYRDSGEKVMTFSITMLFAPTAEAKKEDAENGLKQGDFLVIEGEPNIEVNMSGLDRAVSMTGARLVNSLPFVVQARPGLLSQKDFPPFAPVE